MRDETVASAALDGLQHEPMNTSLSVGVLSGLPIRMGQYLVHYREMTVHF